MNNILRFSKNEILEAGKNFHSVDVFNYKNICEEYNFESGESSLYLEKSDNVYELLFKSIIDTNGIEDAILCSENSIFTQTGYNPKTKYIKHLDYFPKSDYIEFTNKLNACPSKKGLLAKIFEFISVFPTAKNSILLIRDGNPNKRDYNNSILDEYKRLSIKYKCASFYIPAYNILNTLICSIHTYIASKKLDMSNIKMMYLKLQRFEQICPNSCSLISSFINNIASTDLRSLCETLKKNLTNVENLINIYLENELNLHARGENDDCK